MCNTATITRASRACFAASALVTLSASLADATYGPRTKIGNNYQQTSSTMSEDGFNEVECNSVSVCYVLFQVAPAQKPLIVQHVSCVVQTSAGSLVSGSLRTRQGPQDFPFRHTRLVPIPAAISNTWLVNSPAMHLVLPGERPQIQFLLSPSAGWSIECTISGQLQ
jgi:hypothetical protein